MRCGGQHLRLAPEEDVDVFFASKGNAEHRTVQFHHRDKMADINLGYEVEWNSMILQVVSESLLFLSSLLTKTLGPAPLNECDMEVFHRRCVQQQAGKARKCLMGKSKRNSAFVARLHVKSRKNLTS